ESGRISYVNAGHNPPLLVRADGRVETLTVGGMVLGLFDTVPYEEGTSRLDPGDVLVVFTDGVTETFSAGDEEFGEKSLIDVVKRSRGLRATEVEAQILQALETFAAGARATDDRTLIVLKRE